MHDRKCCGQLAFVPSCHTRLQFSNSRAVWAQAHRHSQGGIPRSTCLEKVWHFCGVHCRQWSGELAASFFFAFRSLHYFQHLPLLRKEGVSACLKQRLQIDQALILSLLICAQVYEFQDAGSGMLCIAQPPKGVPVASLVASCLSRALGSPLRLPLEPLLTCSPEALPRAQQVLFGSGASQGMLHLSLLSLVSSSICTTVLLTKFDLQGLSPVK